MLTDDEFWMRRALALAERGRGYVEPNPLVGAVVVQEGKCVGEGWHQRFGEAHAEVNALAAAGEAANGATLYVTLEPCCHHGKTPPCTDAILRAGVQRVVAAVLDPFPQVAGKGIAILRTAGIAAEVGECEDAARLLNAPYLKLVTTGRPYVHAKWAMTLDGKLATRTGDSKWISSEKSRRRVHELRGRMDGILVGIGTVLADDPLLTARPPGPRTATRIILDTHARTLPTSQLAQTAREVPTLIGTAQLTTAEETLRELGCEILSLPSQNGLLSVAALLAELGRRRMTNLLVEGGSAVLGAFFDTPAIDELHVFISPRLAGGADAKTPVGGHGIERITDSLRLANCALEVLDGDMYFHARLYQP
jgi:diaminohydroxyphosphoribosylaminopyrimidine deaminase/5-amino-6-(5-phosphoribosylamino)uracil reductase